MLVIQGVHVRVDAFGGSVSKPSGRKRENDSRERKGSLRVEALSGNKGDVLCGWGGHVIGRHKAIRGIKDATRYNEPSRNAREKNLSLFFSLCCCFLPSLFFYLSHKRVYI